METGIENLLFSAAIAAVNATVTAISEPHSFKHYCCSVVALLVDAKTAESRLQKASCVALVKETLRIGK